MELEHIDGPHYKTTKDGRVYHVLVTGSKTDFKSKHGGFYSDVVLVVVTEGEESFPMF